jgi:hypothetical protein
MTLMKHMVGNDGFTWGAHNWLRRRRYKYWGVAYPGNVEITLLPTRANNQSMGQTTVLQQQQRDQGVVRPWEFGFSYCVLSS